MAYSSHELILSPGKYFWVFFTTLFFLWPKIVLATDPPNLVSPDDNSIISDKSPKLSWEYSGECPSFGSCYRIEVDNNDSFSSPEKTSYINSTSYSPQLSEGVWNFRVKAKDKSEKWSDWSRAFKFTINTNTSAASPDPNSDSEKQVTEKSQSIFEIKDSPAEINSDQEFEIQTLLQLPKNPKQYFYLKAAFRRSDSSNYFAQTWNGNDWVKNGSSYSKQLRVQTDASGKWQGKIKIKPDQDDSGFNGSGDYVLKIARYSDSGSGPTWSNELNIKVNEVTKPSPSPSEDTEITLEEDSSYEALEATIPSPSRDYEISKLDADVLKIASVAGEATMSNNITSEADQTRVLEERKINWLLVILGIGVAVGGIGFTFYKVKRNKLSVN